MREIREKHNTIHHNNLTMSFEAKTTTGDESELESKSNLKACAAEETLPTVGTTTSDSSSREGSAKTGFSAEELELELFDERKLETASELQDGDQLIALNGCALIGSIDDSATSSLTSEHKYAGQLATFDNLRDNQSGDFDLRSEETEKKEQKNLRYSADGERLVAEAAVSAAPAAAVRNDNSLTSLVAHVNKGK